MKTQLIAAALFLSLTGACGAQTAKKPAALTVKSPAFSGGVIPSEYASCGPGKNLFPPLNIKGIPSGAKSLAIIIEDPGVPFLHLVAFDIAVSSPVFSSDGAPAGAVYGNNGTGNANYVGPCPPSGTHKYVFNIFALDLMPDLATGISRTELETAMKNHIVAYGKLTAKYSHH